MALIIGNAANNVLIGDTNIFDLTDDIFGLGGNDWIEGRLANDNLWGGDGNDSLFGGAGNDMLNGGAGNDLLDGGSGNDAMTGGAGNDVYRVDAAGDTVVEAAGGGIDRVESSISYGLGANVENLTLTGGAAINGTGNALNNVITGNNANNVLSGGAGHDALYGRGGNDVLWGGTGNDVLDGGDGDDWLYGQTDHDRMFGGNGNDYLDGGTGNDSLYGNAGHDRMYGGTGNDLLQGGTGSDSLHGGSGHDVLRAVDVGAGNDLAVDRFYFDTPLSAATNVDRIDNGHFTPFGAEAFDDEIMLENSIFTALRSTVGTNLGQLSAAHYFEGAGLTGGGVFNLVGIYNNTATGQLFYNPTFGVAGDSVLFATVNAAGVPGGSAVLSAEEFTLV